MFQILIVEDDKELSQLFRKVLEKNGYQVKCTSDGALALEILDKDYIDLIISDIMMPVMDCRLYTSVSNTIKKGTQNDSWNERSENMERAVIIEKNPEIGRAHV